MTWELEVFKTHFCFYLVDYGGIVSRRVSFPSMTLGM